MRNLKAESIKANTMGLARACVLLSLFLMPGNLFGGDILIESGAHRDTVIQVGPEAEFRRDDHQAVRFETGSDNSSIIRTQPVETRTPPPADPVIITPEIHLDVNR